MLSCVYEYDESWKDEEPDDGYFTEYYVAYDQCWDKETIEELRTKYNIIYNGGIFAIKVIPRNRDKNNNDYLFVFGSEDDGTLYFKVNKWGHYENQTHVSWISDLIELLHRVDKEFNVKEDDNPGKNKQIICPSCKCVMHPDADKWKEEFLQENPWHARYVCNCGWQSPMAISFPTKEAAIEAAAKKAVIIEQN